MSNTTQKKVFDAGSVGFIGSIIALILSITGMAGIQYPGGPGETAGNLVNAFSQTGIYGIIGLLITDIFTPIFNFIRSKEKLNWTNVFSSVTTWTSLAGVAISGFLLFNLEIPAETPDAIAGAISTRNWYLLGGLVALNIIVPVVRWIKSRKTPAEQPDPNTAKKN